MNIYHLKNCIRPFEKDVFYCGANNENQAPVLYVKDKTTRYQLSKLLYQRIKQDPIFNLVKIKTTSSLKLQDTKSLEEILERIPSQNIYFDPTATIERIRALVNTARQARQLLTSKLEGCYFNVEKRNIYFLVKEKNIPNVQKQLEPIILAYTKRLHRPFYFTITVSLHKPQGQLIAVDKASVIENNKQSFAKPLISKLIKAPSLLIYAVLSMGEVSAKETDLPAVSKTNVWVSGAGGVTKYPGSGGKDGDGIVEAGIAAPLTHALGAQIHGTYDATDNSDLYSIDGYIFWRNPEKGLLGPHVMYINENKRHQTLYGLHGEYYHNNWTFVGEAGLASIDNNNKAYAEVMINWYPQPNLRTSLGGLISDGDGAGQLGVEYLFGSNALPGLSVFADVGIGSHNISYGYLGLRYYFGNSNYPASSPKDTTQYGKSLIERHREDMIPPTMTPRIVAEEVDSNAF